MDKYTEFETFIQVIESGSFSAAARVRQMTPSAVSRSIGRIERRLGVRLLDRSTRCLRLTAEGRIFYERARRIVAEIDDVENVVTGMKSTLRGLLRVNASVPFANHRLIPLLPALCRRYPGLQIDLVSTDDLVDVLQGDVDVALRVGPVRDSSLTALKLGSIRRRVVAAPVYLASARLPTHPSDLARHHCLRFDLHDGLNTWPFMIDNQLVRQKVDGPISVNNGESMRYLALCGTGIARLGDFLVDDDIRHGRLVPLLEEFNPRDEHPVHALFAGRRNLPARLRAFLDFLSEHL